MTEAVASRWALVALIGFFLLHSLRLDAPALGRDSWRESDTLGVARNFCEEHAPLWEPRVDQRGDTDGVTGMELPLLNFIVGRLWCATGSESMVLARLVVLLMALFGAWALFKALCSICSPPIALWTMLLLLSAPLFFFYARAVQPDVFSMSLAFMALLAVSRGQLVVAAIALTLAALVKPPALLFGVPVAVLVWQRNGGLVAMFRKGGVWLLGALPLGATFFWYCYAKALQLRSGVYAYDLTRSFDQLLVDWTSMRFWQSIFVKQLFDVYAFPLISSLFVAGLIFGRARLSAFARALTIASFVFLLVDGGSAAHHLYHGIWVTPAIALVVAELWSEPLRPWLPRARVAVLVVALAYALQRTWHWFPDAGAPAPFVAARAVVDQRLSPTDKVVAFSSGDPTVLFHLHRKGWLASAGEPVGWWKESSAIRPRVVVIDRKYEQSQAGLHQALRESGYVQLIGAPARVAVYARE